MYDINILIRNSEYACNLMSTLNQKGFSSNIVQINKLSFSAEKLIILDAHYMGFFHECKGFDLVPQIRLDYGNFSKILLVSWFNLDQICKLRVANMVKPRWLHLNNCKLTTFPLSLDEIIELLNKENI